MLTKYVLILFRSGRQISSHRQKEKAPEAENGSIAFQIRGNDKAVVSQPTTLDHFIHKDFKASITSTYTCLFT